MIFRKNGVTGKVGAAIVLAVTVSVVAQLLLRGKGREREPGNRSAGLSHHDRYDQQVQGRY